MTLRSRRPSPPEARTAESGQIMLLIIGYVVLALIVISAVTAASSVYLEHKRLLSAADAAAAIAAEGFNFHGDGNGDGPALALSPSLVAGRAEQFVNDSGYAGRFDGFSIVSATSSADGTSATVTLAAVAHPPLLSLIVPGGVAIDATSTSRPRVTQ